MIVPLIEWMEWLSSTPLSDAEKSKKLPERKHQHDGIQEGVINRTNLKLDMNAVGCICSDFELD